jgi:hypothetical protein
LFFGLSEILNPLNATLILVQFVDHAFAQMDTHQAGINAEAAVTAVRDLALRCRDGNGLPIAHKKAPIKSGLFAFSTCRLRQQSSNRGERDY